MFISAILTYSGKSDKLNESVAAWISQKCDVERELVIINRCFRQQLACDLPGVKIINLQRPMLIPPARNVAITESSGDVIMLWPEDDICLPNHIQNISSSILGNDWCWIDKEFMMVHGVITRIIQSSAFGFAFTKRAWEKVGRYGHGVNGASDRNFIGKLTGKFRGQKVALAPKSISFIRCGTEAEKRPPAGVQRGIVNINPLQTRDYVDKISQFFGGAAKKKIAIVMLGRNGDIINILPFVKLVAENYAKPHVLIAKEFLPLFDGISYATPVVVADKEEMLGDAMSEARREYQIVVRAQIWGRGHSQKVECDSYNMESWREVGLLNRFFDESLRPVFDRRDPERERLLIERCLTEHSVGMDIRHDPYIHKPLLLVNLNSAQSAPCPNCPSLMPAIQRAWGDKFIIVDLSKIRAERLYDFVGLFEEAAALVSIDTCFLHLAMATNIPVVALVKKAWGGTTIRLNCVGRIQYEAAIANPKLVNDAIAKAVVIENKKIQNRQVEIICLGSKETGELINRLISEYSKRPIFHVVDRFDESDSKDLLRKRVCWNSWDELYESGNLVPVHCWNYSRNSKAIGDRRPLPYLKDLLEHAMAQMEETDICLWTNDDNLLHPRIVEYLRFHVGVYGPCSITRCEFRGAIPSLELSPDLLAKYSSGKQIGRDGFAFTKGWLVENLDQIPDAILGASMWDIHMAVLIRNWYNIKTTNANLTEQVFPAEIPPGYVGHIAHHSAWNTKDRDRVPSNMHNSRLFREFIKQIPGIKMTPEGNVEVK